MTINPEFHNTSARAHVIRGNATCVAAVSFFSFGFPAAEVLLQSWGTMSLIAVRNLLGLALILAIWFAVEGLSATRNARWMRGMWIGAVGFGTGSALLVVTQSLTDPVTTALAAATMPVGGVALEVALDGRRLTRNFVFGIGLVLLGGFLATGVNWQDAGFGLGAAVGLSASALFAWGSRGTVKNLPGMTPLGQTAVTTVGMALFCMVVFAVFALAGSDFAIVPVMDANGWGLMLIYAWVALAISQVFWIYGVSGLGIGVASFHLNAAPFYVMLILLAFGGSWSWMQAVGAAVLTAGVVIAQRRSRRTST